MDTSAFNTEPTWQWPDATPPPQDGPSGTQSDTTQRDRPRSSKRYPPRTCRICLETVLPTYEPALGNFASILNPSPAVSYISSDPAAGRLIRPCKCKGSSRYVHEGCLQAWRHADPQYGKRNYWQCPTCGFRYRLERMTWASWISSTGMTFIPAEEGHFSFVVHNCSSLANTHLVLHSSLDPSDSHGLRFHLNSSRAFPSLACQTYIALSMFFALGRIIYVLKDFALTVRLGTQITLTLFILWLAMFLLGFVADPIINLYLDPYHTISSVPLSRFNKFGDELFREEEESGWTEHFLKGLASLGLLSFIKVLLAMSPWQWWNLRSSGLMRGSGGRAGSSGRDRLASISWVVVVIGVGTFIWVRFFPFPYPSHFHT